LTSIIKQLIKLRNQYLNIQKELGQRFEESETFNGYTKKDIVNMYELVNDLEKSGDFNIHDLWHIPKKTHDNEEYENGELTE